MADPAHQPRREEAAGHEAAGPGRAEQAERGGRKAFRLAAQRQEQPCRPDAASRKAVPRSSDRIGR